MMFVVLVGLIGSMATMSLWRPRPRVRSRPGRRRLGPGIPAAIAAASDGSIEGDDDVDFGLHGGGDDCGAYDGGYEAGGSNT